jgi:AcrR family transcriptional regulator
MRSARSSRARSRDEHGKKTRVDVRETILCEATRLFGERGFGGVALRDIAKACDIPLSTLSSHFARKRNLQEVVFQRAVEIIVKRGLTSRLTIGGPKQRFRRYLANVVELFLSDLPEMKLLDKEFQELDKPSTFDRLVRTSREPASMDSLMLVAELARDTKSDILSAIPAVELMQMVFAAIYGIVKLRSLHRHVIGGRPVSNAALTRDITLMFERMLRI